MVRFRKLSSALVMVLLALTVVTPIASSGTASASGAVNSANQGMSIYFFYGDGCPHCAAVEPLIENLTAEYPQVNFLKLEVWHNNVNKALFNDFNARYRVKNPVVPEVFIADQALIAEDAIKNNLESNIQRIISTNNTVSPLRYIAPETTTVIKTAHPEVNFITADGAVFNSSQVAIQWNYTNGQANVATVEVSIDGGSFNSLDRNATSYVANDLSNGNHTLNLRINDGSGSSERSLNFSVDLESKTSSSSVSSPLLIGFSAFILTVGISLVFVQRTRRKA